MGIFRSLVKKEALHIVRDKRTMVIALMMPLVLLLLFGFAISTEINNIRIVAVVGNHTLSTREILEKFEVNDYFTFQGIVAERDINDRLKSGESDAAIIIRDDQGELKEQIIVDASNPSSAQAMTAYIKGVLENGTGYNPILTQTLYNPQLKSAYNFVPGILGMIFILICAIITSVSIVREKETGTMNLLLVSPIKPNTIILGKLVPYFLLSCIILAFMLTMSYSILGLPFTVSGMANVVLLSLLYILLSLSIGLLVSVLVNSQLTALIVSAVAFMLPVILLSGMIFPIDNMPLPLQWFSCILPARWYIEAMRKLMIQQLSISHIWMEFMILAGMTLVLVTVAIKKFRTDK